MSHIKIMAKEHVDRALVIRTSTGLQNVVPGTPLELPLADLEGVGKQCAETDYDVKVVGGDSKSDSPHHPGTESTDPGNEPEKAPAKLKGVFKSMKPASKKS